MVLALAACSGPEPATPDLPALPPRQERGALPPAGVAIPTKRVTLAWTAEVRGEIEPCGCPTVPYGGFERRAAYVDQLRAQGDPVFVLDAGEMLVKGARGAVAPDLVLRAKTVLNLSREVGLDAWAPSATDRRVADGWPLHDALGVNAGLPGSRVFERGGVRVGVIGVSGAQPGEPVSAADLVAGVKGAIVEGGEADGWVVLSNASPAVNLAIAEGVPELGMVLATRGGDLDPPRLTGGAPILEAPDRGRFVSVVRWVIGTAPGAATLVEGGEAGGRAKAWDEALERLSLQTGASETAERGRVQAAWEALAPLAIGRNLAIVRDRPLGSDLAAPTGTVAGTVEAFKVESIGEAQARTEMSTTVGYKAAGACTGCHTDYFAAWTLTPHAKAWQALVSRGATTNPECVGCHSTAWGQPGGNASTADVPMRTWKAVQCESCHGPLSAHVADPRANHATPITEATCTGCHDDANSPEFDYGKYLRRVSCVGLKGEHERAPTGGGQP